MTAFSTGRCSPDTGTGACFGEWAHVWYGGMVVACLQVGALATSTIVVFSVDGFWCDQGKFAALGSASGVMVGKWDSEANRLRLWVGKSLTDHYPSLITIPPVNPWLTSNFFCRNFLSVSSYRLTEHRNIAAPSPCRQTSCKMHAAGVQSHRARASWGAAAAPSPCCWPYNRFQYFPYCCSHPHHLCKWVHLIRNSSLHGNTGAPRIMIFFHANPDQCETAVSTGWVAVI